MTKQKTNQKPPKITPEQARERGRKGGIAKGRNAAIIRSMKEITLEELNAMVTDKQGNAITVKNAMAKSMLKSAVSGNLKAAEMVLKIIGEFPSEKHEITGADGSPLSAPDIKIIFDKANNTSDKIAGN